MLYLTDPCAAFPFWLLFPTGRTKEDLASIVTFCPEFGEINKSEVSVEILFPDKRSSSLITKSVNPNGSILNSAISSNVRFATAVVK